METRKHQLRNKMAGSKNKYKSTLLRKKFRKGGAKGASASDRRETACRAAKQVARVKANTMRSVQGDATYGYAPKHKSTRLLVVTPDASDIARRQAEKQRELENKLVEIAKILSQAKVSTWSDFRMVCKRERVLSQLRALLQDPGYDAQESVMDETTRSNLARPINFKPKAQPPREPVEKEEERYKVDRGAWNKFKEAVGPEIVKHLATEQADSPYDALDQWMEGIKEKLCADQNRKFRVEPFVCEPALKRFKEQNHKPSNESQLTFHGTSDAVYRSIKSRGLVAGGETTHDGFKVPIKNGTAHGRGVYSSPNITTAMGYCRAGMTQWNCMFANIVTAPRVTGTITVAKTSHVYLAW